MSEPKKSVASGSVPADPAYRVLARKYRPASFEDLIGQDAMVRTISNAFESGRIPQAWILTGVRGVGKTTTARILARALNYELPDGSVKEPTIHMPVMGVHCQAIIESRHPDVLEMDAASHNSVDDVRQINDAIRYAPMTARYKVYILDEVHMLSGAAFNALLKTLEEPPPHAKRSCSRAPAGLFFRGRTLLETARARCTRPPIPWLSRSPIARSRACLARNAHGESCSRGHLCQRAREATRVSRVKHWQGKRPCGFPRRHAPRPVSAPNHAFDYV